MLDQQPVIISADARQRKFATSAVAVQAIIVNQKEEILLLSSPTRKQGWQVVSGALEARETLLDGTLREVYEELGKDIRVRPLGTVLACPMVDSGLMLLWALARMGNSTSIARSTSPHTSVVADYWASLRAQTCLCTHAIQHEYHYYSPGISARPYIRRMCPKSKPYLPDK